MYGLVRTYQRADGRKHITYQRIEHHQATRGERLVDNKVVSNPQHRHRNDRRYNVDAVAGEYCALRTYVCVAQQAYKTRFGFQVGVRLDAKTLNGGDGIERFYQLRLQVGCRLHDLSLIAFVEPVEQKEHHEKQGRRDQCNQGQFPRIDKHHANSESQYQHIHHQVYQYVVDKRAYLHRIVNARNDFAHAHGVEELLGQV